MSRAAAPIDEGDRVSKLTYMICEPCRAYIRSGHWERHLRSARHAGNEAALKALIKRVGTVIG